MATVDLFAIGNALIDHEFTGPDNFLTQPQPSYVTERSCMADARYG